MAYTSFDQRYKKNVIPILKERFGYTNIHAVPKLERIVLNVGVGRLVGQRTASGTRAEEAIKDIIESLQRIGGQKPIVIISKKSIAGFKLREGMINGVKATLRHSRMKAFFDRLIYVALPRTRDFRGIPRTCIDPRGNLTIGLRESVIFPELTDVNMQFGLEVTFVTSAHSTQEGFVLLEALGIPFQKEEAS